MAHQQQKASKRNGGISVIKRGEKAKHDENVGGEIIVASA